jgi:L-arabinose isomerase
VRLIKRPLGIGRLDDPPTFLFQYQPGPATVASLVSLEGERFRLVVAEGENLDSVELPALEMPYGQFRPASGLRACLNGWLRAGGPHHEVMNLGHHAASCRCSASSLASSSCKSEPRTDPGGRMRPSTGCKPPTSRATRAWADY